MSNEIFSDTDTPDWNKLSDSYEQYVDKYISFEKKLQRVIWKLLLSTRLSCRKHRSSAKEWKELKAKCQRLSGLATWDFRSDAQDGPSERHEIIKVESLGDDWYQYEFYDMGIKGSHKI